MEVYESIEDLEAQVEPLLVEEVHSAFDHEARPVQITIADEESPAAYVHGLLRAYALAVERDARRQGWLGRIFNRGRKCG